MTRVSQSRRRGFSCRSLARALAVSAASALTACAVVSSDTIDQINQAGGEPAGVYYALPMGLIDVTLIADPETAEFRIVLGEDVKYIADPDKRYLMRYRPLPNYEDEIEIEVHPNSLISKVWATTSDQTDEIIVQVAKLFRGFGGFQTIEVSGNFKELSTITIDPSDPAKVRGAENFLNDRAKVFIKRTLAAHCAGKKAEGESCRAFAKYTAPGFRLIEFDVVPPAVITETKDADCTVGLCYRVKEPYVFEYAIDGVREARIVYLPNRAPLIELDVTRAIFVEKIQKIDFDDDGFLKSAHVEKPSELLAASKIPLDIITAISETLPVRLTVQQRQTDLAEKEAALVEAKRNIAEARDPPLGANGSPN